MEIMEFLKKIGLVKLLVKTIQSVLQWSLQLAMMIWTFSMSIFISKISPKKEKANNVLKFLKSKPLSSVNNKPLGLERNEK